ncbi:M15 family metallopeptidase [Spirochaeta dissipatitropha]
MPLQNRKSMTGTILPCILLISFFSVFSCTAEDLKIGNSDVINDATIKEAPYLHPDFSITESDLEEMIRDLPQTQQESIRRRPQVFLDLLSRALDLRTEYTVLVDKVHALSENFRPSDLVSLNDYPQLRKARNDLSLAAEIMPMVLALNEAAAQDGITLTYGSTYRSYQYQVGLFNHWVNQLGYDAAARVSAKPGHSQHQLGTVIDFSPISQVFSGSRDYEWLKNNAHLYGFSLSYPEGLEELTGYQYESWHWRYIHETGIKLQQEFFDDIQQYYLSFLNAKKELLEQSRQNHAIN